jgi:precorrin-2/cobalt-factor-2 C20-methyltransferase
MERARKLLARKAGSPGHCVAAASPGVLYGVGVGPGEPELLTLKAARLLREVPVLAVPKRCGERSYAFSIVQNLIDERRQEVLELPFAMRKDQAVILPQRREAARLVLDRLRGGRDVAFLTEGDPFFYSTFVYLFETLSAEAPEVKIEIVPGVTSVNASAIAACVPLAVGEERVAILPATYEGEKLLKALDEFDTVVLMKVNSVLDKVIGLLDALGLKDNAVLVEKCGSPEERVFTDLESVRGQRVSYLTTLIVRKKPMPISRLTRAGRG